MMDLNALRSYGLNHLPATGIPDSSTHKIAELPSSSVISGGVEIASVSNQNIVRSFSTVQKVHAKVDECVALLKEGWHHLSKHPLRNHLVMIIGSAANCNMLLGIKKVGQDKADIFPSVSSPLKEFYTYVGCPGLGDRSESSRELAQAFFRTIVTRGEKSFKWVIVLDESDLKNIPHLKDVFEDLIQHLGLNGKPQRKLEQISQAIALIVVDRTQNPEGKEKLEKSDKLLSTDFTDSVKILLNNCLDKKHGFSNEVITILSQIVKRSGWTSLKISENKEQVFSLIHEQTFYLHKKQIDICSKIPSRCLEIASACTSLLLDELKGPFSKQLLVELQTYVMDAFKNAQNEEFVKELLAQLQILLKEEGIVPTLLTYAKSELLKKALSQSTKNQAAQCEEALTFLIDSQPSSAKSDQKQFYKCIDMPLIKSKIAEWITLIKEMVSPSTLNFKDGVLAIKGYFPKASEIKKAIANYFYLHEVQVYGLHSFLVDEDLSGKHFKGLNLTIIAPIWQIPKERVIDLSGKNCTVDPEPSRSANGSTSSEDGKPGIPGKPGQSGGNFLGIAQTVHGIEKITLISNGGKGGRGGTGGDGHPGHDAIDKLLNSYEKGGGKFRNFHQLAHEIALTADAKDGGYTYAGEPGADGGHGGQGGAGGMGGNPGNLELIAVSNPSGKPAILQVRGRDGERGSSGQGATGGGGGVGFTIKLYPSNAKKEKQMLDEASTFMMTMRSHPKNGKKGTKKEGINNQGIQSPLLKPIDPNLSIMHFYKFLLGVSNPLVEASKEKFLVQMSAFTPISNKGTLSTFIQEVDFIEEIYRVSGKRCIPLCRSVLQRMSNFASKGQVPSADAPHLHALISLVATRLWHLQLGSESRLVVNIGNFLSEAPRHFQALQKLEADKIMTIYKADYESQLKSKIADASVFIQKLSKEILDAHVRVNQELQKHLQEVIKLSSDAQKHSAELEIKRQEIEDARTTNLILGGLNILIQGVGMCFPPFGPIVAGVTTTAMNAIFTPDPVSIHIPGVAAHLNGLVNTLEQRKHEEIDLESAWPIELSDKQRHAIERKQLISQYANYGRAALSVVETGAALYQQHKSDEEKLKAVMDASQVLKTQKEELDHYQNMVSSELNEFLHGSVNDTLRLQEELQSHSRIALEFDQLSIKRHFDNIKATLRQSAHEQISLKGFTATIRQMEDVIDTSMNIYKLVQDYQERMAFAIYLSKLIVPQPIQANEKVAELKAKVIRNLALEQYNRAITAVQQWAFPFGDLFLGPLTDHSSMEKSGNEELIKFYGERIKQLSTKVKSYQSEIHHLIDKAFHESLFCNDVAVEPFYIWKNSSQIESLFKGEQVLFYADVNQSPQNKSAIKFNFVEIEFSCEDKALQTQINKALNHYQVIMRHSGHSFYRYRGAAYHQSNDGEFELMYSFQKNASGVPYDCNGVYKKMKNGEYLLSPYTEWAITLKPAKNGAPDLFKTFREKMGQLQIELVGKGQYVVESDLKESLNMGLYAHNKVETDVAPFNKIESLSFQIGPTSLFKAEPKALPAPARKSDAKPSAWFDVGNYNPQFSQYTPRAPLAPVPNGGITVGLKNFGNTCWLNSILKFIAATTYYDQMFTEEVPINVKRLQSFLRDIICALRTNKAIEDNFFKAFLNELDIQFNNGNPVENSATPRLDLDDKVKIASFYSTILSDLRANFTNREDVTKDFYEKPLCKFSSVYLPGLLVTVLRSSQKNYQGLAGYLFGINVGTNLGVQSIEALTKEKLDKSKFVKEFLKNFEDIATREIETVLTKLPSSSNIEEFDIAETVKMSLEKSSPSNKIVDEVRNFMTQSSKKITLQQCINFSHKITMLIASAYSNNIKSNHSIFGYLLGFSEGLLHVSEGFDSSKIRTIRSLYKTIDPSRLPNPERGRVLENRKEIENCFQRMLGEINEIVLSGLEQRFGVQCSIPAKGRDESDTKKRADQITMPIASITQANVREQNDAPEFLLKLLQLLRWSPNHLSKAEVANINASHQYPRLATVYQPTRSLPSGLIQPPALHDFMTSLILTIPESMIKEGKPINIDTLINEREFVNLRPTKAASNQSNNVIEPLQFEKASYIINQPRTIMLYIRRFKSDQLGNYRRKIDLPILLDSEMKIRIRTLRNPSQNSSSLIAGPTLQYRIGAAIEHQASFGGIDAGHYVCKEKAANGTYILHDDTEINPIEGENFGTAGYFIRLDLIG